MEVNLSMKCEEEELQKAIFVIIFDGMDSYLEKLKYGFEQCQRQSTILLCFVDLVSRVYVLVEMIFEGYARASNDNGKEKIPTLDEAQVISFKQDTWE
ncbi:hypothetical protein BTVI_07939 [Pitangus sulphuratus]|nr:hypothetical protein BTVI_07939 [Pitangus sulphuratus]